MYLTKSSPDRFPRPAKDRTPYKKEKVEDFFYHKGVTYCLTKVVRLASAMPMSIVEVGQLEHSLQGVVVSARNYDQIDPHEPILVIVDGGAFYAIDGTHRLHKARALGQRNMWCRLVSVRLIRVAQRNVL